MKRIVISLLLGVALTIGAPILVALVLYHGDSDTIVPTLLYWPLLVTDKLGIGDCANANLIAEKLNCMSMALLIDAVSYPLIIFVCAFIVHRILLRRGRPLRPSHVA